MSLLLLKELIKVRDVYPEFFKRLVELESKFHSGGSLFYISGERIYARDLLKSDSSIE